MRNQKHSIEEKNKSRRWPFIFIVLFLVGFSPLPAASHLSWRPPAGAGGSRAHHDCPTGAGSTEAKCPHFRPVGSIPLKRNIA